MTIETGMESDTGDAVSLKSVHIDASVSGLLLNVTTQQHYKNTTRKNLEVVYTFPLPAHAVILGVDLTIGEKTLSGVVLEKSEAEEDYEEAIAQGDLPVMVERSGPGLYTANLGNLKRGEEVAITVRWAQLLNVRDDSVRIAIPTVIGKRYGEAHAQGGLAPHQTDEVDMLAEYPLSFTLAIEGELSLAKISCASHQAQISSASGPNGDCKIVSISSDAYLDRDVIVNLEQLGRREFFYSEANSDGTFTALASFYPQLPNQNSPLALKILVDCSGSMQGDSIEQAREAVHQVLQQLKDTDYVSYSRFGTEITHNFCETHSYSDKEGHPPEVMIPANERKLANIGRLIRSTKASMGGTEMRRALLSTLNDVNLTHFESSDKFVQCVLLITDGNIWDLEGVMKAASGSGQRIFAIGVGSSPVEGLLRELTEKTGGTCEFVTPNEPMAPVALRMVQSMRSALTGTLSVNWPEDALWTSHLPQSIFGKDTIHSFATLTQPATKVPNLAIDTGEELIRTHERALPNAAVPGASNSCATHSTLARIAAHGRMLLEDETAARKTALQYGLISAQTNLLLVYVREAADKTKELPTLEQIKQMAAAGHSGMGTAFNEMLSSAPAMQVRYSNVLACHSLNTTVDYSKIDQPTVFRVGRDSPIAKSEALNKAGMDRFDIPAFLRRQAEPIEPETPPGLLIETFNRISLRTNNLEDAIDQLGRTIQGDETECVLEKVRSLFGDVQLGLSVLILWISEHRKLPNCVISRHSARLLQSTKDSLLPKLSEAYRWLDDMLGNVQSSSWNARHLLRERST